jgi:Predicted flavin-nucleotide-binding protein
MIRNLTPSRMSDRMTSDRSVLDAILDEAPIGYLGISLDEGPLVLPVSYARDGDRLLLHGSTGSHRMRAIAAGAQICFSVSVVDALKISRTGEGTGMRYRSAVLFGACSRLEDAEKERALDVYLDRYVPGRTAEVRRSTKKELAATMVLILPIDQWSVKTADGFCEDEPEDVAAGGWAGVVPLRTVWEAPIPNPELGLGTDVPASILRLTGGQASDSGS